MAHPLTRPTTQWPTTVTDGTHTLSVRCLDMRSARPMFYFVARIEDGLGRYSTVYQVRRRPLLSRCYPVLGSMDLLVEALRVALTMDPMFRMYPQRMKACVFQSPLLTTPTPCATLCTRKEVP